MSGTLYLVATPIGNLEDMTFRAIRILKEVDLIAAEDTRNSIKLLNHFEIDTPMTSYHEFNRFDKGRELVDKLLAGQSIAVITDAGTPGISDPGEVLVQMCHENGIGVVPVPGAVAGINALVASGQKTGSFIFEAFLPSDKTDRKARREVLDKLKSETRTIILYEAPHRLVRTLEQLAEVLGGERSISLCKELTKKHENIYKTTIKEALEMFSGGEEPRGEYVLVIAGKSLEEIEKEKEQEREGIDVEAELRSLIEQGYSRKDASKTVAERYGLNKKEVYAVSTTII